MVFTLTKKLILSTSLDKIHKLIKSCLFSELKKIFWRTSYIVQFFFEIASWFESEGKCLVVALQTFLVNSVSFETWNNKFWPPDLKNLKNNVCCSNIHLIYSVSFEMLGNLLENMTPCTKAGVSNWNPLKGRMSMKNCSAWPQFIGEGCEGHVPCQIWCFFFIQVAFKANFWPFLAQKSQLFHKFWYFLKIWSQHGPHRHSWRAACLRPLY